MKKINWKTTAGFFGYYAIEILYHAFIVAYLFMVTKSYGLESAYQLPLFYAFIAIVLGLSVLLHGFLNKITNFILCGIYSAYLISQNVYFRGFSSYYRLKTIFSLKKEILGASDAALELVIDSDWAPLVLLFFITVTFIAIFFCFQRKLTKFRYRILPRLLCLLVIQPIQGYHEQFYSLLEKTRVEDDGFQGYTSDYFIYETMPNVTLFADTFGLVTLGYHDIYDLLINEPEEENEVEIIDAYIDEKEPVINQNDYSGILAGKNILFVQAESFNQFALDEELTPTIWKLMEEGIRIDGFNTPALAGSTSDTEFMSNTSLVPNTDGEGVCYRYVDNTYPTTLAGLFKENGYDTLALHNNYDSYYNRFNVFESLGYESFLDCTELGLEDESSDLEVAERLKYIIADADYPLMTYWITYSGHQPYTLDSVGVEERNVEKIRKKYPNLSDKYVSYLAKNMDLDQALEIIINQAEYTGTLDNLVIVFYGDHCAKGMELRDNKQYLEEIGVEEYEGDFNNTELYIYSPSLKPTVYEKCATTLDLLPTIANMFGFTYDEDTVLGRDIFDENYHGFYFSNYDEIKTDNYYYNLSDDTFDMTVPYSKETAYKEIEDFEELLLVSKYILRTDYFALDEN